ncbi:Polycystin 2 like 1 transient receptor potential cation channel [Paragonimus heterotremus]|uniref:Polycystin 2 like 1 transient receptor potential cation channel n=1 Tax=Paragonimus heterotremus TaxID=100268 RepID=A0A8J4TQ64_9TREM|nr:Polycystin 2 like 1 transient receptor potential cation channel [Paragonimus heterotremus]
MSSELKKRRSTSHHVNFAYEQDVEQPYSTLKEDGLEIMDEPGFSSANPEMVALEADADRFSCWKQCTRGLRSLWATRLTEDVFNNRDLYIHTTLRELILYVLFLITLMIVAFVPINENTYLLTNIMEKTFLDGATSDGTTTLRTALNLDDLWQVIQNPVMDAWYDNTWYNGQPIWLDEEHLSVRYDNHLIGVPRLRQLRVSYNSCVVPVDFRKDIKECYGPYSISSEDRSPFGMKNGTAWTFTSSDSLQMQQYLGSVAAYGGGGYYVDLSRNRTEAAQQLQDLFENLWLDRGTRAVFIHFTTYNANLNIFCVVEILLECPASGGIVLNSEFRSIKLLRYVTTLDYFVLACECIFLLFTVYYIVEEIMEIAKHRLSYFTSIWNILDIIIIILSLVCAAFNIYRTVKVTDMLDELLLDRNKFPNFQWLSIWQVYFNYGVAVTVFLSWVKLFKYISFNKTMTQLSSTLGNCAKDLAGFAVMFFIVFFSFAELGYLAFGTQVNDFRKFMTSVYTLFRIILGDFDFNSLERANSTLGPIYFIVYVFFVFFVLINMFIAIINETYVGVKSDLQTQESEFEVKDFFKKRMKKMLDRMKRKKTRIEKLQQAMELANTNSTTGRMGYEELCTHLNASGFSNEEISNVFGRFDSDHDQMLSSSEQLKLQAKLEEEKMALVNEIAKEEKLSIDTGTTDDQPPRTPEVTQSEFTKVLKRIGRIEGGMSTVMQHLSTVLTGLSNVEKTKLIRREAMTRLLQAVATEQVEDRGAKLEEILSDGLQQKRSDVLSNTINSSQFRFHRPARLFSLSDKIRSLCCVTLNYDYDYVIKLIMSLN